MIAIGRMRRLYRQYCSLRASLPLLSVGRAILPAAGFQPNATWFVLPNCAG
jgi:hypothetical protein